jgi:hypothetical protein
MLFRVLSVGDGTVYVCTRINSVKWPASGAGKLSDVRLMSQVGRVREVRVKQCVSAVRAFGGASIQIFSGSIPVGFSVSNGIYIYIYINFTV